MTSIICKGFHYHSSRTVASVPRSPTTKLLDTKLLIWVLEDGARRPPSYFICKAQDNIYQKNMLYNIKTEKKEPVEPLKPLPLHHSFRHQKNEERPRRG